jgi:hypothetical protein
MDWAWWRDRVWCLVTTLGMHEPVETGPTTALCARCDTRIVTVDRLREAGRRFERGPHRRAR